jgi:hypothetical protein
MNKQVAYSVIDAEVQRLRKLSYSELIKMVGTIERKQVAGADGKSYNLEYKALWDSIKSRDVTVIVYADDGGWRVFKPLTRDFIMRPDGGFAGEPLDGKEASSVRVDQKIDVLKYELDYRRNKQWNVFSWCSAILVAVIGGTSFLNRDPNHALQTGWRVIISSAVIGLTTFACLWLTYNADRESVTAKSLEAISSCEIQHVANRKHRQIGTASAVCGYRVALFLLAIATLFATWWP